MDDQFQIPDWLISVRNAYLAYQKNQADLASRFGGDWAEKREKASGNGSPIKDLELALEESGNKHRGNLLSLLTAIPQKYRNGLPSLLPGSFAAEPKRDESKKMYFLPKEGRLVISDANRFDIHNCREASVKDWCYTGIIVASLIRTLGFQNEAYVTGG